MSDFNQQSHYGVNYGSQNQTNAPYLPPYSNQYSQTNDGGSAQQNYIPNYDVNAGAYGYNQSMPGFNTSSVASVVPPLPIYQGWSQDPLPLPTYNAPPNNLYTNQNYTNYPQSYPPIAQHQSYQPIPQAGKPYDDRAVNDTEYSNVYAPPNHTPVIYSAAQYRGADGNGYADTAHRAVYPVPQDVTPVPANRSESKDYSYGTREVLQIRRPQSSTSHTPSIASPSKDFRDLRSAPKHSQTARVSASENSQADMQAPPYSKTSKAISVSGKSVNISQQSPPYPPPTETILVENPTKYESTVEGREDAKLAVLKLYPQKIGYNEILEGSGVSEEYLKPVFEDLKLSRGTGTPVNGRAGLALTPDQKRGNKGTGLEKANEGASFGASKPQFEKSKEASEDKITNVPSALHSMEKGRDVSSDSPIASTKSASVAEKERTLQLKMEALRKSREERAQKAAAKNASSAPVTNTLAVASRELQTPIAASVAATVDKLEEVVIPEPKDQVQAPITVPAPAQVASTSPLTSHPKEHWSSARQASTPLPNLPNEPVHSTLAQPQTPALPILSRSSSYATSASEQPAIPGLFMNQRKRPVAADFDTPVAMSPFKRPFGHSRSDTPLIIDVSESEDEDGDVEMELDSPNDPDSSDQKVTDQRNSAIQNPPQSFSPAIRKPVYTPPQVLVAPTAQRAGKVEVLRQKEQAIEEMRRKIAEAEAAKALKRAQRIASGSNTPHQIIVNVIGENENLHGNIRDAIGTVQVATQIQQSIDNAEVNVNTKQKRLAEAHAVELEKASELKKQELQSKQLRRQKIAIDLPRVDAEVQEKKRKLEEIRAQMAQMEADVQKTLDDKQKMAEELEALSQEAEDQLQSQKQRLDELNGDVNGVDLATPPPASPHPISPLKAKNAPRESILEGNSTNVDQETALEEGQLLTNPTNTSGEALTIAGSIDHPQILEALIPSVVKDITNPDQALESALQEAARVEADSSAQGESDAMDTEDFYGPSTPNPASEGISIGAKTQNRSYSPLPQHLVTPSPESDGHDVDDRLPHPDTTIPQEEESDDYEPAEAASPLAVFNTFNKDAMFDNAEVRDEGEVTDEAEYIPVSSEVETGTEQPGYSVAAIQQELIMDVSDLIIDGKSNAGLIQRQSNFEVSLSDDGIEEEDRTPQTNGSASILTQVPVIGYPIKTSFTPYESPLKHFNAFRFHPDYNEAVSGGYRSLTYSHKINPDDTFCPWELGGVCNDKTCTYQHFKDVGLPDDAVLSKLGSPDEFIGEQRTLFCDGLKGVLTSLRAQKIRSFDLIAHAVVEHRAKFLGDKSKVLPLEGTLV